MQPGARLASACAEIRASLLSRVNQVDGGGSIWLNRWHPPVLNLLKLEFHVRYWI